MRTDTVDAAALQEVVTVLKAEVERHARHARRLQRENRFLVRSVLRMQQQRRVMSGAQTHSGDEAEQPRDYEATPCVTSGVVSASHPSSSSSASSAIVLCHMGRSHVHEKARWRRQQVQHSDPSPLVRDAAAADDDNDDDDEGGGDSAERGKALLTRVKTLERQLRRERLRRRAEADEFTVELELLRLALDEAEHRAHRWQATPSKVTGDAFPHNTTPLGHAPRGSAVEYDALSEGHGERVLDRELVARSVTATAAMLRDAAAAENQAAVKRVGGETESPLSLTGGDGAGGPCRRRSSGDRNPQSSSAPDILAATQHPAASQMGEEAQQGAS
ncbi:hypothetical protein DQ04_16581000, partial [Trypanosoma grayi]|uniref:hypothetical protein n=1 Tax=Trypanosoma grayi TaxID=71804 RepID=UPI0004F47F9F